MPTYNWNTIDWPTVFEPGKYGNSLLFTNLYENILYLKQQIQGNFAGKGELGDATNPSISAPGVYAYENLTISTAITVPSGTIILVNGDLTFAAGGSIHTAYALCDVNGVWPRPGTYRTVMEQSLPWGHGNYSASGTNDKGAGGGSIGAGGAGTGTPGAAQAWDGMLGLRYFGFWLGGHQCLKDTPSTIVNRGGGSVIVRVAGDIIGRTINQSTEQGLITAIGQYGNSSHENGGGGGSVFVYCQGTINNLWLSARGGPYFDSDNGGGGGGLVICLGPNAADAGAVYTNVLGGRAGSSYIWDPGTTNAGGGYAYKENMDPSHLVGILG